MSLTFASHGDTREYFGTVELDSAERLEACGAQEQLQPPTSLDCYGASGGIEWLVESLSGATTEGPMKAIAFGAWVVLVGAVVDCQPAVLGPEGHRPGAHARAVPVARTRTQHRLVHPPMDEVG